MHTYTDFCSVYIVVIIAGERPQRQADRQASKQQRAHTIQREASCGGRERAWAKNWRAFFNRARFSITSWDPDRSVYVESTNQNARYIYIYIPHTHTFAWNRKQKNAAHQRQAHRPNFFFSCRWWCSLFLPLSRHDVRVSQALDSNACIRGFYLHFFFSLVFHSEIFSGVEFASVSV